MNKVNVVNASPPTEIALNTAIKHPGCIVSTISWIASWMTRCTLIYFFFFVFLFFVKFEERKEEEKRKKL